MNFEQCNCIQDKQGAVKAQQFRYIYSRLEQIFLVVLTSSTLVYKSQLVLEKSKLI